MKDNEVLEMLKVVLVGSAALILGSAVLGLLAGIVLRVATLVSKG